MSGKQQGLRYFQKFLNSKASERNALAKKVLRCVLAVGFVLSPWLGGEAYADAGIVRVDNITLPNSLDKTYLQNGSNVAHIYAEQASGDVGLNRFKTFEVGAGQIANLYFKTSATDTNHLNTLVNTVQNQISISGTVNGIKDGNVGGNLYFLSPAGMVIGSTGVINAGSLTVMTTGVDDIKDPAAALSQIGYVYRPLGNSPITIQGKINTANGIDLRSLSIEISKNANGDIPCLKTGMVFNSVVNTDGLVNSVSLQYEGSASGNGELQLKRSDSTDTKINLVAYKYAEDTYGDLVKSFGNITLSGCELDAIGDIEIDAGNSLTIDSANLKSKDLIKMDFYHDNNNVFYGDLTFNSGKIEADGLVDIRVGKTITIGNNAEIISSITKDVTTDKVTLMTSVGDITNNGTISTKTSLDIQAGVNGGSDDASITNSGTIKATGGGMSFTVDKSLTNNGLIQADDEIAFRVGGTLTNQGTIQSTSSNVQAHIGRDFKNIAVPDTSEISQLTGGIIEAGGNVQVDYNLDTKHTYIGVATPETGEKPTIDGIYNSGLIWAKGDKDPVKKPDGTVDANSGSGNIWLTSAYNITNDGTMKANRQITLNARDFLHNYGLIQGVTYLDIKSIMGYVYNHASGVIRATGGNIDLSTGQANLQIDGDTNGQKKEEYRKFTPIIIEGKVEATSALNNTTSETNQGNINIRAYLGDIYVDGGTIEAKAGPNGEVESVAGNVTLDAAQNITIGFKTEYAEADDPTTDSKDGGHPEYASETERGYYKPKSDYPLDPDPFPTYPSGKDVTISGSNITLTSGDNEKYYILISNTTTGSNALPASNTLTASNAITINTDSMNIVGGTFNAGTLEANLAKSGALSITGGTINAANVNSNRNMIINGGAINTGTAQGSLSAKNISMESGSVTGKDVTIAAAEQVQLQGGSITAQAEGAGKLTVTAGTNLVHDGATIAADNATFSAGNKIDLQSGSLTATGAAAFGVTSGTAGANSIVESTSDYSLSAGSLSLSANQGNIILNGTNNVLQGVTIANVGGNIEIVNGNDTNKKALTIATAEGTTVGGTINVTNNGEGITVAGINAANDVNLTAGENITVAGDVNAANASFNAGQDFIQNSGTITASGAVVTAGRDVKLNAGSMEASTSVSLTAGSATSVAEGHGYISEGTEYALIAPQVTASAVKAITLDSSANQLVNVDITQVGGDLAIGSGNKNSTEALQVNIAQGITVNGSLTIKNYKDVGDNSSNDIVLAGALSANRITITNAEADINAGTDAVISADSISLQANSGAVNVDGNATITARNTAENNGTFAANAQDINIAGGQITADTVTLTAANAINQTAGSIVATTTVASAGTDLSLASNANKLQNVTVKANNGSASIVSGNDAGVALKVQTDGTVGGSLSIQSTSDVVSEGTISAAGDVTMTAGDKVTINSGTINANSVTAKDTDLFVNGGTINVGTLAASKGLNIASNSSNTTNITANNITAGGSIGITGGNVVTTSVAADEALNITGGTVSSDGAVSLSGATGVTIGSAATINTGGDLTISSSGGAVENNRILNITTGSVTLSGSGGVTNNMNITAAQDIILQSTTGAITNSGILSAGQGIGLTSTEGTILNNGMLSARGSSVSLKGYKGIINNGYIEAKGNVSIISEDGSITNRAGIVAGKSFATPAASPFSLRARAMARAVDNGSVVISGKDGVINHNDNVNTSISAAGSVSITSEVGAVQNSSAVNTSGSVEISGSNVTNSGALTTTGGSVEISGSEGVTNNADIKAGSGVSLNATTGDVKTSGTIQAGEDVSMTSNSGKIESSSAVTTSGSVEISGSSGVNNSANITANDNVTMSSGAGSVTNSSDVKAGTGSVEISGNGGVTNTADITANQNVNLSANTGAISNAGSVTAETGNIGLNSNNGITSTAEGASLNVNSLNGSISAATTYGEVNISEIISGGNATASSQNGSVSIGTVAGNDVVLTGGSNVTIGSVTGSDVAITGGSNSDVNVDNITVDNSLKLQGDNITATNVNRSENASGALNVDVSGAGDTSSTAQGDVNLKIDGDVVFNNFNVTDAKIETTGNMKADSLHVEGKAQITSSNTTVNVYGKDVTPDPNDRNAIQDKGGGVSLTIDSNGVKSDDLRVDYPVQLSGKLVDYDPYDTYLEHYGDVADLFGRSDLIQASERPTGETATREEDNKVVLKQDADGLRLEEQKQE